MPKGTVNMNVDRRAVLLKAFAIGCGALTVRVVAAQEVCKAEGPSFDEMLKEWADAAKKAKLDKSFEITILRLTSALFSGLNQEGKQVSESGVVGELRLNGKKLGDTLENEKLKVPAGEYRGLMRYVSGKNFVAGALGKAAQTGDFLVEVADVKEPNGRERTDILLHSGTRPWHSRGCILTGAAKRVKDAKGDERTILDEGSVLRELRKAFYGTDGEPLLCPNKSIRIKIVG